ncbi:MAG: kelch repeat-containing protein, partial [Nitrososphaeraceae archaeon]
MQLQELFKSLIITFCIIGVFYLPFSIVVSYTGYHIYSYAQGENQLNFNNSSFWTTGAPLPTPRSEIAGTALNEKIYIIGGFDESGQSTTIVEVYDPKGDNWTTAAPLPRPLDHTAATFYDGKLYVVGGGYLNRDNLSDKLFIYDPNTNSWTEGANLPVALGALTAKFINGTLYAVGGVDISGTSN